jgi:prepilin-type N-terminal cleavage/methylation domain-containing protein
MRRTHRLAHSLRRAFTLVELLTVIAILAIVIAIIIPVMGKARIAAKNADTLNTLTNVGTAVDMFKNDKRHLPGYFSPRAMGDTSNTTANGGFDQMSNLMLDLIGGVTNAADNGTTIVKVGPAATVNVDLASFGANQQSSSGATVRGYFVPDAKRMVAQASRQPCLLGTYYLPSLIDAFGQPILAWVQDEIPSAEEFSADTFVPPAGAKFYWAQNSAFLDDSVKLGKMAEHQAFANGGSLISRIAPNKLETLDALLGSPSAPDDQNANKPKSARAPIILHAAGADGVFVGKRDRGGKSNVVQYKANTDSFTGLLFDDQIRPVGF